MVMVMNKVSVDEGSAFTTTNTEIERFIQSTPYHWSIRFKEETSNPQHSQWTHRWANLWSAANDAALSSLQNIRFASNDGEFDTDAVPFAVSIRQGAHRKQTLHGLSRKKVGYHTVLSRHGIFKESTSKVIAGLLAEKILEEIEM